MKKQLSAVLVVLILTSFACSIQNFQMKTIETEQLYVSEMLPGNAERTELFFKMVGGEFILKPDADGLINGTISYNVQLWEPKFTRLENYFAIEQVNPYRITGLPSEKTINDWDLSLTTAIPLDLSIEGGASKNTYDFTGLQLTRLNVVQGASETTIRFDAPNPITMREFIFTTGASSAELIGLANANFESLSMSSGAGDYTLDFSGTLIQDASVTIKSGVSNLTLIIPAGMKAVINNNGALSNINTRGAWVVNDKTYTTESEGATLTIDLEMALGNINLIHGD